MSKAQELADDVLSDLLTIHERTSKGKWAQGTSSHHTVAKREGRDDYHIANFHHADDASFVDQAHKYMPLLIAEVRRLDRVNAEMWDFRPQLTDPVHGAEPCMGEILKSFYLHSGIPEKKAIKYAADYIAALSSSGGTES